VPLWIFDPWRGFIVAGIARDRTSEHRSMHRQKTRPAAGFRPGRVERVTLWSYTCRIAAGLSAWVLVPA